MSYRSFCRFALACLLIAGASGVVAASPADPQATPAADAPVVADPLPDEIEKQIEEKTESLPDEIRDKVREQIREAIRRKMAEQQAAAGNGSSSEEKKEGEAAAGKSEDKPKQEGEEEKPAKPEDSLTAEARKMREEMELIDTRFRYRLAEYRKQLEERRLIIEKSKMDQELEQSRKEVELQKLKSELDALKVEAELQKLRRAVEREARSAELAEQSFRKEQLESKLALEAVEENVEDRILEEERYPDEPFRDGVLTISDRRIELNGPIFSGAAQYVCDRLDFFNNQSSKPIFLVIDSSPGGSAIEGFQIVQAMRNSNAPVHVVVKRYAASMAAIITTLAEHSYAYPNAILLHHQASAGLAGNGRDLEDQIKQFKEISRRLIGEVAGKIGTTEEEFVKQMYENRASGDWDLFADQAVEKKWVKHVVHTIREEAVRERPKGMRPAQLSILSLQEAEPDVRVPSYLDRYEVRLQEQVDEHGKTFVKLPRINPLDVWLIYNPDKYYR
jgi:ATP-dependent Clp protease protease subunit